MASDWEPEALSGERLRRRQSGLAVGLSRNPGKVFVEALEFARQNKHTQCVHGQKKRRKRTAEGLIELEGIRLKWELLSEPQKTTEHGYKGLCISVRVEDGRHRELVLEYPFPKATTGNGYPQIPQRPKFSEEMIETYARKATRAGWDPLSRGKTYVFLVPEVAEQPASIPQTTTR